MKVGKYPRGPHWQVHVEVQMGQYHGYGPEEGGDPGGFAMVPAMEVRTFTSEKAWKAEIERLAKVMDRTAFIAFKVIPATVTTKVVVDVDTNERDGDEMD